MTVQDPKTKLGVGAAAHEFGGQERVPNRPPELTLQSWLDWEPKYIAQCVADINRGETPVADQYLRELFKATNG